MQTHLMSKIMHQNLAVILWQFNYGKNSFIILVQKFDMIDETIQSKVTKFLNSNSADS